MAADHAEGRRLFGVAVRLRQLGLDDEAVAAFHRACPMYVAGEAIRLIGFMTRANLAQRHPRRRMKSRA